MTFLVRTGDGPDAVAWYSRLLGRGPDVSPLADLHEWELVPGAWLQVATGAAGVTPSSFRVRFGVADLTAAITAARDLGVAVKDPEVLPGTVAWTDLSDPWGNPLGLFQELAGSS
ncbi:VOC family protein [Kineococcus xinjiangensis]|uniref:VOC family protein n=1 Tax=Kineococcus xinjiangensis TaxID=512762 RepID=UPI000CECB0FD|nr:glyoxalase [Kineococcus xinjiangensis]